MFIDACIIARRLRAFPYICRKSADGGVCYRAACVTYGHLHTVNILAIKGSKRRSCFAVLCILVVVSQLTEDCYRRAVNWLGVTVTVEDIRM